MKTFLNGSSPVKEIEQEIIQVLSSNGHSYEPAVVYRQVRERADVSDTKIREAIWRLMDRKVIELTPKQQFRLTSKRQSKSEMSR